MTHLTILSQFFVSVFRYQKNVLRVNKTRNTKYFIIIVRGRSDFWCLDTGRNFRTKFPTRGKNEHCSKNNRSFVSLDSQKRNRVFDGDRVNGRVCLTLDCIMPYDENRRRVLFRLTQPVSWRTRGRLN